MEEDECLVSTETMRNLHLSSPTGQIVPSGSVGLEYFAYTTATGKQYIHIQQEELPIASGRDGIAKI